MTWQEPIVALVVLLAAGFLARNLWGLFAGKGGGCGSCGKNKASKPDAQLVELGGPRNAVTARSLAGGSAATKNELSG